MADKENLDAVEDGMLIDDQENASEGKEVILEPDAKTSPADEGIESLKKQLAAAEKARQDAETRAHHLQSESERVRQEHEQLGHSSQLDRLTSDLERAQVEADKAYAALRDAKFAGNNDNELEAQRALLRAEAKRDRAEHAKAEFEARRSAPPAHEGRVEPQRPSDPVEALIQGARLSPRAADFVRSNRHYVADQRSLAKLTYADTDAQASGLRPDTDEYFAHVRQIMDGAPADTGRTVTPARDEAPAQRRAAPAVAAPVERSTPGMSSRSPSPRSVKLTAAEIEAAEISGISPEQYARNKLEQEKNGRLH